VENSLQLAGALRHAGVSVELHIYEHGNHGQGLGFHDAYEPEKLLPWTRECSAWLKTRGFVK
jgi:dipeptidyl aminopeptidase/acylaminoacyl peptidase